MDAIVWLIVGAISGAATVAFWDRIKEWATRIMGLLLDAINTLVEVIGGGFVYLIKEGKKYYKSLELYTKDIESQKYYRRESNREETKEAEIPRNIRDHLKEDEQTRVLGLNMR